MILIVEIASWILIMLGSLFTVVGALGLVRLPDVFTRMHAASVIDTLGVGLLILGMGLQAGLSLGRGTGGHWITPPRGGMTSTPAAEAALS